LCNPFFFLLVDSVAGSLLAAAADVAVVELLDPAAGAACDDAV
jgi:hypothetical protein